MVPAAATPTPTTSLPADGDRHQAIERSVRSIGPRVREQRALHGLSLQQAAVLAGVSAASIHKVERGDMVPTVTTLLKLAAAFGLPLSSFVDEVSGTADAVHVVRADERPELPQTSPGTVRATLSADSPRLRLTGEHWEIAPGATSEQPATSHPEEQLWYVLDGTVEVEAGTQTLTLRKGDAAHQPGDVALVWHNRGRRAAQLVQVRTPADRG